MIWLLVFSCTRDQENPRLAFAGMRIADAPTEHLVAIALPVVKHSEKKVRIRILIVHNMQHATP